MRCVWICTLLLLAASPVFADVVRDANELARRLQYEAAEQRLQQVLPDLHDEERAQALLALGKLAAEPREARRRLAEAQKIGSGATREEAALELARLEFARGNYRNAVAQTEPYPDDAQAALWHGLAAAALGDLGSLPAILEPARKANDFASLLLGWAALRKHDARAALDLLEPLAARRRADDLPTALLWKAQAQAALGQADEAARTAASLRERFPETPEAQLVQQAVPAAHPTTALGPGSGAGEPAPRFAIQLGAFEDRTNALRLQSNLQRDYPSVHVVAESSPGRPPLYRVVVGSFDSRDAAEAYAAQRLASRGSAWQVVPVPEDAAR